MRGASLPSGEMPPPQRAGPWTALCTTPSRVHSEKVRKFLDTTRGIERHRADPVLPAQLFPLHSNLPFSRGRNLQKPNDHGGGYQSLSAPLHYPGAEHPQLPDGASQEKPGVGSGGRRGQLGATAALEGGKEREGKEESAIRVGVLIVVGRKVDAGHVVQ